MTLDLRKTYLNFGTSKADERKQDRIFGHRLSIREAARAFIVQVRRLQKSPHDTAEPQHTTKALGRAPS